MNANIPSTCASRKSNDSSKHAMKIWIWIEGIKTHRNIYAFGNKVAFGACHSSLINFFYNTYSEDKERDQINFSLIHPWLFENDVQCWRGLTLTNIKLGIENDPSTMEWCIRVPFCFPTCQHHLSSFKH